MKKILSLLTSLMFAFSCFVLVYGNQEKSELKFKNGKFTILQISDPQDDMYPAFNLETFLRQSIENTKPDLIVITGDLVEDKRGADTGIDSEDTREGVAVFDEKGNIIHKDTLNNTIIASDNILKVIDSYNIPFAFCLGNNDHGVELSNKEWYDIISKYKNSLLTDDDKNFDNGINYNVLIKDTNGNVAFNIWCMDTGSKAVSDGAISWYKNKCEELRKENNGNNIPSFVFQHIQVKEIGNLFERCNLWEDNCVADGIGLYRLNRNISNGYWEEVTVTPGKTSDEFKSWLKEGDVIGAYFGHEHYEGYTGTYKGIELGYTYGCEFSKKGPYGYRVLTLYENDIKNYSNELYTFSTQTKSFSKQNNSEYNYPDYSDLPLNEKLPIYFENIINNLTLIFKELFD